MSAVQGLEYLDARGRSPYGAWFDKLNAIAAAKVAAALYRLEEGNFSNVKGSAKGCSNAKSTVGPANASTSGRKAAAGLDAGP